MSANPVSISRVPAARDHFVRFYDRDEALVPEVATYLRKGLESGRAAITISSAGHLEQVLETWRHEGFNPQRALERGQLVMLDARATLEALLVEGMPDPARFDRVVGGLVRDATARHGGVVAFGEMVSLLCEDNRHGAAIELESLWNQLSLDHPFSLFCAYRTGDCATMDGSDAFSGICAAHSHVMPAEDRLFSPHDEPAQLRRLAELQCKAAALERELERRLAAEAKLAAREREFADFLENGVVGLHRVGPDGTILWANRAELAMLGYTADEYVGRNIADFHADHRLLCRILETLSSGGMLKDQAARLICKDGSLRHVLINSNAQMEDGKFVATRCFTRDVTDRWLAQEALRERGAVLHLAMQGARMGYWVGDLEAKTVRCSYEMALLFGLPDTTEWPLDTFVAVMHAEDRAVFRGALDHSIEKHSMFSCEFRVRGDGADWRWFEARGEPVYDDNGVAARFYGVCTDVTARKRQEHMLELFAAVVDGAQDAIVTKTLDGIITSWNAAATRLFGYEAEEMIGRPISSIIPPHLQSEEAEILAKLRAGGKIENYVTSRMAKDGSVCRVSISISPVRDVSGRIIGASKIARSMQTSKPRAVPDAFPAT